MRAWLPAMLLVQALFAGCTEPQPAAIEGPPEEAALVCEVPACVVRAVEGYQAEPWVAIDPSDPQVALVATFGTTDTPGSWVHYARTEDGGRTWAAARAPGIAGDALAPMDGGVPLPVREGPATVDHRPLAADPMALFTGDGEAVLVALVGRNTYAQTPAASGAARPSDIVLWRSTDGGRSFGAGEVIVPAEGAVVFTSAGRADANRWHDKPFLVADGATGELHLFWNDVMAAPPGTELLVAHSKDGGRAWSTPSLVASGVYGASASAYDGVLLVTARNPGYQLLRSLDSGRAWERLGQVGDWPGPTSTWQAAPVAWWKNGSSLEALLVRAEGREGERVVLQRSADLGATWSEPVVVMPLNGSAKRNPVLALDAASGRGFVAAYQGIAGDGGMLETWVAPLDAGAPRPAFPVSVRPARADAVFEYFGGAASAEGGVLAYVSAADEEAPLHAVGLRWQVSGQAR